MVSTIPRMTSAVRTIEPSRGFTLIELVIALAIAALVMGGAMALMIHSSDERMLRDGSGGIELLAKRARAAAVARRVPYALEFREHEVRLMPLAEAGKIERRTASGRRIGGEGIPAESDGSGGSALRESEELDEDLRLAVRRWNSDKWIRVEDEDVQVWRFDPGGLCEPLSVRLERGESWIENVFHPLTAAVADTTMAAQ